MPARARAETMLANATKGVAMNVEEVMTKEPIAVGPETPLKDVAAILVANGISGLPVIGVEKEVLGVVSEADLVAKSALPEERERLLPLRRTGKDPKKASARTAGEAMTSPALTIGPRRNVGEAARTMIEHGVNRLPVVDDAGHLVGIVTRADLVRTFARPDEEIRREIEQEVVLGMLWIPPDRVKVQVHRGEVKLEGRLETEVDVELLPRLVERVPGVVSVTADLHADGTDSSPRRRILPRPRSGASA